MLYIDTSTYYSKIKTIRSFHSKILKFCQWEVLHSEARTSCSFFNKSMENKIARLESNSNALRDLIGNREQTRVKRGWINAIGRAAKVVFGTLEDTDAERYDEKINNFEKKSTETSEIIKSQANIMKVVLANFNDTIKELDANFEKLTGNVHAIYTGVHNNTIQINHILLKANLEEYILLFNIIYEEFEIEKMILTNAIIYAQKGLLNPSIITPAKLIEELNLINKNHLTNFIFPVPLQVKFAHHLLKALSFDMYFKGNKLVYIINIPLVEHQTFNIFKASLFPIITNEN